MTPKSTLLGSLASFLLCIPCRINTCQGEHWALYSGFKRLLYIVIDNIVHLLSTSSVCMSRGEKSFLARHLLRPSSLTVVGSGSICGVDGFRFSADQQVKLTQRYNLAISNDAIVLLYAGRICRDKGLVHLLEAFSKLYFNNTSVYLLLVGPVDDESLYSLIASQQKHNSRLIHIGYVQSIDIYMKLSDVFIMPSLREGFGLSVIEAMSTSLPVVATDIYGLSDICINNYNSIVYRSGDTLELCDALDSLVRCSNLRLRLGSNGRVFAMQYYEASSVLKSYLDFIKCSLTYY